MAHRGAERASPARGFAPSQVQPRDTPDDAPVRARPHPLIRGAHASSSSILVNSCQRGNPLLTHIKGVAWEYADIVPDYQMGLATGALFLSLRYHRLHPEYIHARIQKLAHMYTLRVLLVLCDVNDHQPAIKELTKVALVNRMALIVAWSPEEAARYLETYKAFEHKPPDLLRSRVADDYMSQLTSVLTNVRGINKTDVLTLASRLGSISDVADAPHDTLMMLPGMGDVKARHLAEAFQQPLRLHGSAGGEPGLPAVRPPSQAAQAAARPHSEQDQPREHEEPPHADPQEPVEADISTSEPLLQSLPEGFESLPEEEQLRIALQMSVGE